MIRSHTLVALLGIGSAIACSDEAEGTGEGGALSQTGPHGGTTGGPAGGASTGGASQQSVSGNGGSAGLGGSEGKGGSAPAGGKPGTGGATAGTDGSAGATGGAAGASSGLGGAGGAGKPSPTTPTTAVIPGATGCDVLGVVWQSDTLASVFLSCGLSQTTDGGVTFAPPRSLPIVGSYEGALLSGESFAALDDGSLFATAGYEPGEGGSGLCQVFRSDPKGAAWYPIATTHTPGSCRAHTAVAARGETAYFTAPYGGGYGVAQIVGWNAQWSVVSSFGQSMGFGGAAATSTQPSVVFPALIEEGGAVWAYSLVSVARRAAEAPIGAYGPTFLAPKQASFIGLNGQQVAWIADGELYGVPTSAPDFGSPVAVPGLTRKGAWQGAADEGGRIAIVESASVDPTTLEVGPFLLATLRPDAKTAADVHGFAPSPALPDATYSVGGSHVGEGFRVALRKGRLLIAATKQGEVVVHGFSPSF